MKIRQLFALGMISVLLLAGCSKKADQFSISGRISHAGGNTIYLEKLLVSVTEPLDSAVLDRDGNFEFQGKTDLPSYYLLKLSDSKFITLLVDSTEQVEVKADVANFEREYQVEGSQGSLLVKELVDRLSETQQKLDSLQSLHNLYKGNPDYSRLKRRWNEAALEIKEEQTAFSTRFVMDHPFSMASVLALYQKFSPQEYVIKELQPMRVAASALNSVYPGSPHVKALYQNTLQLLKDEQNARLQQLIREQGENSPDIVLPTPSGEEVALSSLRGKVVLLQFWSALDRSSRILNEALVEAYRKYKNRGFEIYQVSVDENRIEWVDAIDKDRLSWINVGDMEGSKQAVLKYNVQAVPYNYLLDSEGVVVAKDLKGPELDKALSKVLN